MGEFTVVMSMILSYFFYWIWNSLSQIIVIGEWQLDSTYQTVTAVSWFNFTWQLTPFYSEFQFLPSGQALSLSVEQHSLKITLFQQTSFRGTNLSLYILYDFIFWQSVVLYFCLCFENCACKDRWLTSANQIYLPKQIK